MKSTLMLPLVFFAYLVFWLCVLATFSTLGDPLQLEVLLSRQYALFFTDLLYQGLRFFPAGCFVATGTLYLYIMRHKIIVPITALLLSSIVAALILFIIPTSYSLLEEFSPVRSRALEASQKIAAELPSAGIIYADKDSRIVWFSDAQSDVIGPGVLLGSDKTVSDGRISFFSSASYNHQSRSIVPSGSSSALSVPALERVHLSYIRLPAFVSSVLEDVSIQVQILYRVWKDNQILYFIYVGSAFLLVLCFFTGSIWSGWRLLNAICIFALLRAFFLLWRVLPPGGSLPTFLSLPAKYISVQYFLPGIFGIFSLVLFFFGIVLSYRNKVAARLGDIF